jgi:hypothetical protein
LVGQPVNSIQSSSFEAEIAFDKREKQIRKREPAFEEFLPTIRAEL